MDMDGFPVAGDASSIIGDSVISFSPLKDAELRRRARNNTILAKIQELEASASVQAARSERFRMMRAEYESLVRKYATNRRWNGGMTSNGYVNGNEDHQNAYQFNDSQQQQPFVSSMTPSALRQPFPAFPLTTPSQLLAPCTTNVFSNSKPSCSLLTIGVNTDITGPVRPVRIDMIVENDDLQGCNESFLLSGRNKDDVGSEFQQPLGVSQQSSVVGRRIPAQDKPQVDLASPSFLRNFKQPNNTSMVLEKDERGILVDTKKNLPLKMEMMMMLEDEEDGDEESFIEAGRSKRKQELQQFHQRLHPKAPRHDSISISSTSSPGENATTNNTTSNTTEDVLKLRRRLPLENKLELENTKNKIKKHYITAESEKEETSVDTTVSFAPGQGGNDGLSKTLRKDSKYASRELPDLSLSDSTSLLPNHQQRQRKLLLQQLSTSKSNMDYERKSDDVFENPHDFLTDGSGDSDEERSVLRQEKRGENYKRQTEDDLLCSSPTTGGATSESLGDSLMDSIQKTPDTLPRDDSELHGIAEVNEEDEKQEEIELYSSNKLSSTAYATRDDGFAVAATAGVSKSKRILTHSGINDKLSDESGMSLKKEENEIKELELHEQINDAKEIRSNNLSSSKLDAPDEEEGFTHANNPAEETGIPTRDFTADVQQTDCTNNAQERKNSDPFYEDISWQTKKPSFDAEFRQPEFQDRRIGNNSDSIIQLNESNKEKSMISHSHAPSANIARSSTTSSFSIGSSSAPKGESNIPKSSDLRKISTRQSSSASSSASSSRQHSIDDQVDGSLSQKPSGQNFRPPSGAATQQQSPTLPQSMHKRHHQLEKQVRKEHERKNETPVGADITLEHVFSPTSPPSNKSSALGIVPSATNIENNNSIKEQVGGDKTMKQKDSKTSPQLSSSLSSSPSLRRTGDMTENQNESDPNWRGSGTEAGITNPLPSRTRSSVTIKPSQSRSTPVTNSGPKGAQNTARRVRLKLNYDDSESDSSDVAPKKTLPTNTPANAGSGASATEQLSASGIGISNVDNNVSNKKPDDDEFDDFYDM